MTPAVCRRSPDRAPWRRRRRSASASSSSAPSAMPRSLHQVGIAQRHGAAVHVADDALAGDRIERPVPASDEPALARRGDDGGGQRVLAGAFERWRQARSRSALGPAAAGTTATTRRPALGQRAGLVEDERVDLLQPLQRFGERISTPAPRALADADHDRHRRREAERAGAGDDEHRDGGDQGVGEAQAAGPTSPRRRTRAARRR